jgi:two-component system OmpR family sensor kinase
MTDLPDDPAARLEDRPSLRRRFMLTFGVLFVVGAVVLRLIHYSTTVTAMAHDVDLELRAHLFAFEVHDRLAPLLPAGSPQRDDGFLLPTIDPVEAGGPRGIARIFNVGARPIDLSGFRWFAGGWKPDGTTVHAVDLPARLAWDPAWASRLGAAWTTADGQWRLAAIAGADGTVLVAGTSTAGLRAAARNQALYQLATFVLWVPFVLGVAWLTLARVLSPLATIAATARRIRSGSFGQRIDVTHADAEVAEVAGTINAMLDKLDDIREAQSRFNADVAHQLVNPVHAILLECDAEGRGAQAAGDLAEALDRIDGLARRIEEVCEGLLCYSRTAALDPARLRPIDLEPIVAAAIERVERRAEERGIRIVPPASGAVIRGDSDLLEEVIVNLLTNAIDHGATGDRIEVTLAIEASRCRMAVIDHGPGVPLPAVAKLFDRFQSGKAFGGHGIGLALSRRIARSHGGDLFHQATPGGGATFVLDIPAMPEPS